MADYSDVENTLVTTVAGIVYPNSTGHPSIVNCDVRVFRGWPAPANLDADLKAGKINISINRLSGMERITTRFDNSWQTLAINQSTITATVTTANPSTITIGGTVTNSLYQTIMVLYNGMPYPYVIQAGDTLNTIAANIAALVPGASALGSVISFPAAYSLIARVGTTGTGIRETKRQEIVFAITTWTPSFSLRDSLCSAIDAALSAIVRLILPDGYYARLRYVGSPPDDGNEKAHLYMRTLHYAVEFATTQTETEYTITDPYCNLSVGPTGDVIIL